MVENESLRVTAQKEANEIVEILLKQDGRGGYTFAVVDSIQELEVAKGVITMLLEQIYKKRRDEVFSLREIYSADMADLDDPLISQMLDYLSKKGSVPFLCARVNQ